MSLLSIEDGDKQKILVTLKKTRELLSFRTEIEKEISSLKPLFNELIGISVEEGTTNLDDLGRIPWILIEILTQMQNSERLRYINSELDLNLNYFIFSAGREMCMLRDGSLDYNKKLEGIIRKYGIEEFSDNGRGKYSISRDGENYTFCRIFTFKKLKSIQEYKYYREITSGKQAQNCHGFNSGFSRSFPNDNFVTGNIASAFNELYTAHSWIESNGKVITPNLNFYQSIDEYYNLTSAKDCVTIPFERLEEDYQVIISKNPKMEYYDYLRDPDGTMARLR
jgi:hypothetical protein